MSVWVSLGMLALINLVTLVICVQVAQKRGADTVFWTILPLLIGPLALPFVFMARPQKPITERKDP